MRSRSRAKSTPNCGPAFGPTSGPPFNSVGVRKRKHTWRTARSAGSGSRLITDGGPGRNAISHADSSTPICSTRVSAARPRPGPRPVSPSCSKVARIAPINSGRQSNTCMSMWKPSPGAISRPSTAAVRKTNGRGQSLKPLGEGPLARPGSKRRAYTSLEAVCRSSRPNAPRTTLPLSPAGKCSVPSAWKLDRSR